MNRRDDNATMLLSAPPHPDLWQLITTIVVYLCYLRAHDRIGGLVKFGETTKATSQLGLLLT